jgi:hypothetical protein
MEQNSIIKSDFNKNEKQLFFNFIRGKITEINDAENWCSYTLSVGNDTPRLVNLTIKKVDFDKIKNNHTIGDKVLVKFYITSRYHKNNWYTNANIISIESYGNYAL